MLEIGQHCEECGYRDFLPFNCPQCDKVLCTNHRTVDTHHCTPAKPGRDNQGSNPAAATVRQPAQSASVSSSTRNAGNRLGGTTSRPTARVSQTGQAAAARSSVPVSKAKQATSTSSIQSEGFAALNRLKDLLSGKQSRTVPAPKNAREKTNIALPNAVGDTKIPMNERVYLTLKRPTSTYTDALTGKLQTRPEKTVAVLFSKTTKVGQVVDRATELLGVSAHGLILGGESLDPSRSLGTLANKSVLEIQTQPLSSSSPSPTSIKASA